jgi:hypothetical protein
LFSFLLYALERLFRQRVLHLLLRERPIDEAVISKLLGWRHSGFSLHNAARIGAQDTEGRRAVAEYILRSLFCQEKLRYQAKTWTVIYRSKMRPGLKRNFEVFSACDWLAALTAHIPNAGEHLVRYYGWYSNVNRGKRRKAQTEEEKASPIEACSEVPNAAAKRAWSAGAPSSVALENGQGSPLHFLSSESGKQAAPSPPSSLF